MDNSPISKDYSGLIYGYLWIIYEKPTDMRGVSMEIGEVLRVLYARRKMVAIRLLNSSSTCKSKYQKPHDFSYNMADLIGTKKQYNGKIYSFEDPPMVFCEHFALLVLTRTHCKPNRITPILVLPSIARYIRQIVS